MATTSANESRARDSYNDFKGKTDYKPGYFQKSNDFNRTSKDFRNKPGEHSFKQGENSFKPKDSHFITQDKSPRNNMPRNNDFRTKDDNLKGRDTGSRPRDFRPKDNGYRPAGSSQVKYRPDGFSERNRNSYSFSSMIDKDEENDIKNTKGHKASDVKARSGQNKDNDLQPDKLETIKRLEREKKIIQKKNREEELEKPKRPQTKQRRVTKDWTKDYEYGLLDEEADYSEF